MNRFGLGLLVSLLAIGAARAEPPFDAGPGDEVWTPAMWGATSCYVTNISGSEVDATVQLFDDEGMDRTLGGRDVSIAPAATAQVRVKRLREERPTACRVVVGRSRWVRVSLCNESLFLDETELHTACLAGQ